MITLNQNSYDALGLVLANSTYQVFVDTLFATKYNTPQFSGDFPFGIPQIELTYEQLEAKANVYSMATIVDLDSPAPLRATQGVQLSVGSIPRMKHGFTINEKEIRTQMLIAQSGGQLNLPALQNILFDSTDKLIGGNYSRLTNMAFQAESNGTLVINQANNPDGISLNFDFRIPAANKQKCGGWGTNGTKFAWFNVDGTPNPSADPIGDMLDMVLYAQTYGVAYGQFSMSLVTWTKFIRHPSVKSQILSSLKYTEFDTNLSKIRVATSDIVAGLADLGLPPVVIKDSKSLVEKFNKATGQMEYDPSQGFNNNSVVLRPSGSIGETKCAMPIIMAEPDARIATFDGGRTLLTQLFDVRTKHQEIWSELTAIPVLGRPTQMLYLDISSAAS